MELYHGNKAIGNVFNQFFTEAKVEVCKLGVRQTYFGEDSGPSWLAWDRGDRRGSVAPFKQDKRYKDWISLCQDSRAKVVRGQIAEEPLHPYMVWSLLCVFRQYEERGAEQAYTLTKNNYLRAGGPALPNSDFVVFDRSRVLQWKCDDTGRVIGGWTWDISAGDDIGNFLELWDVFMRHATPLGKMNGIS